MRIICGDAEGRRFEFCRPHQKKGGWLLDMPRIADEVMSLAREVGWTIIERRTASTGSIYIEMARYGPDEQREWVVVRVANHKQVYQRWLTVVSVAPGDRWFEELGDILIQPFGDVGDILWVSVMDTTNIGMWRSLVSALVWGTRGRWFESSHSDQWNMTC